MAWTVLLAIELNFVRIEHYQITAIRLYGMALQNHTMKQKELRTECCGRSFLSRNPSAIFLRLPTRYFMIVPNYEVSNSVLV